MKLSTEARILHKSPGFLHHFGLLIAYLRHLLPDFYSQITHKRITESIHL